MKDEIFYEDVENKKNYMNIQTNKIDLHSNSEKQILNNNKNKFQKNFKLIEIKSEAFPDGYNKKMYEIKKEGETLKTYQFIEVADIHKILEENSITLDKDMIYYQKIPISFVKELKILHFEWFPVEYQYDYFLKYLENKKDYFNIGAFTKIKGIEYLIGKFSIKKRKCFIQI